MIINLDKEDLINLVRGKEPNYELMSHPLIKANGTYCGGFNDVWSWNYSMFNGYSEEQIYEVYKLLKNQCL